MKNFEYMGRNVYMSPGGMFIANVSGLLAFIEGEVMRGRIVTSVPVCEATWSDLVRSMERITYVPTVKPEQTVHRKEWSKPVWVLRSESGKYLRGGIATLTGQLMHGQQPTTTTDPYKAANFTKPLCDGATVMFLGEMYLWCKCIIREEIVVKAPECVAPVMDDGEEYA